jgi:tetratricopeptide (TPR) repeat protein
LPDDIPPPLRAVIAKALAGDINHRYHSAEEFERDLRAFLEKRVPIATGQKVSWEANATVQKNGVPAIRQQSRPTKLTSRPVSAVPLKRQSRKRRLVVSTLAIAHLAGILAGLLMLLPVAYYYRISKATEPLRSKRDYAHDSPQTLASDWTLYQSLKDRNSLLGPFSPVIWAEAAFRDNLISAGDNILDGYRTSSDTRLSDFDWLRARACLRHALEIDPSDTKAKGKLALAEGYLNMVQYPRPPRVSLSIDSFRQASTYLPKSPDSHLGLARLYVYGFRNIGEAMPEFQQAERLGYQLGPREATQEADGYLYRSEWELGQARKAISTNTEEADKWIAMSRADADRASSLYEPLVGYSNVSANIKQIYEDRAEQERLQNGVTQSTSKHPGFRKWQ